VLLKVWPPAVRWLTNGGPGSQDAERANALNGVLREARGQLCGVAGLPAAGGGAGWPRFARLSARAVIAGWPNQPVCAIEQANGAFSVTT